MVLIFSAAQSAEQIKIHLYVFSKQVANLACSMSNNEEGVKMVRMAAGQIESLCPQVINAARILAARPKSKVYLCWLHLFNSNFFSVKIIVKRRKGFIVHIS